MCVCLYLDRGGGDRLRERQGKGEGRREGGGEKEGRECFTHILV